MGINLSIVYFPWFSHFRSVRPFFHFNGDDAKLSQEDEPFKVQGSTVLLKKGETVKFPCPAAGGPNLTITWERDNGLPGKLLPPTIDLCLEKHQRDGHDLVIPDTDESDEGEYRCIATATVRNETKSPEYELVAVLTHYLKKEAPPSIFAEGSGLSDDTVVAEPEDANYKLLSESE